MEKKQFEQAVCDFILASEGNYVTKEKALRPDLVGMKIFDEPLFGYAAADDPCFNELKKPEAIGPHFLAPEEWLGDAKTVISVFLPFTAQTRTANSQNYSWPAEEWLHSRIDGQAFQGIICSFIDELLKNEGYANIVPFSDPRYSSKSPVTKDKNEQIYHTSNWSERHIAFVAGLGTFGLSRGLITSKGIAGRIISVVTTAIFDPTVRKYTGVYEYCINCGICAINCPAGAISKEEGKMHPPCLEFLDAVKAKHMPYYGCGKCQIKVPCEAKTPNKRNSA